MTLEQFHVSQREGLVVVGIQLFSYPSGAVGPYRSSKSIHGRSPALRHDESRSSCGFPPSASTMKQLPRRSRHDAKHPDRANARQGVSLGRRVRVQGGTDEEARCRSTPARLAKNRAGGLEMSDSGDRVAVIGAGIVGVSCAIFLQRLGRHVVLIDRLDPGDDGASSFGNAGALSWTSCVPTATPGLLRKVPGWLLNRTGPLTIRWRNIPTLAPWLWRYVRSGSLASVEAAAEALSMLHSPALALHRELAREAGVEELIRSCGYLHIYRRAAPDRLSHLEWRLRTEHGARLELLDGGALHEVEPDLAPNYAQAVMIHDQGYTTNPSRLVSSLAAHFVAGGGERVRGEVRDLQASGDAVRSVTTESGSIDVAEVVIAAGAWSTRLTRMLGIDLPLEAERGYHVTLGDPGVRVSNTIMETEASSLLRQWRWGSGSPVPSNSPRWTLSPTIVAPTRSWSGAGRCFPGCARARSRAGWAAGPACRMACR